MDFVERLFIGVNDITLTKQRLKLNLIHFEKKKPLKSIIHCSCLTLLLQKVFLTFVTMAIVMKLRMFMIQGLGKLENFQVCGQQCNVHSKIWSMNTFDTWNLYKKHHVSMSITNLHALNSK
jgi:hypothetical protein